MALKWKLIAGAVAIAVVAGAAAYWFGYGHGLERRGKGINSFAECEAAGYPVGESYPRQCWTPDGRHFTEEIKDNFIACPADAMQCPDGTWVGRSGPNCVFDCN